MAQVQDAVDKGATVHTGGRRLDRPGAFVEATVLTDVTPEMRAYYEELFGPVAVVYKVKDAEEALALANDSPFGLGGAVYHSDPSVALDIANRLDTGMVWINEPQGGGPELPVRRDEALRRGTRARPLRHRRVHQPQAHPRAFLIPGSSGPAVGTTML